jgi:hypothetical protein
MQKLDFVELFTAIGFGSILGSILTTWVAELDIGVLAAIR